MDTRIYFNEIEPFAAAWLGNLYPAATVDQRSIDDVQPNDVSGFDRGHFFAGIAGWELALDLAGWPADRPIWTGSCPCQPFSAAGKQEGAADERHLWPAWYRLIRECRPPVIFGEQVPRAIAHGWLDAVFTDLEAEGYACGAVVLGACGVGAPHIRQRLYWVAESGGAGSQERGGPEAERAHSAVSRSGDCGNEGLANAGCAERGQNYGAQRTGQRGQAETSGGLLQARGLADPGGKRRQQDARSSSGDEAAHGREGRVGREPVGDYQPSGNGEDGGRADRNGSGRARARTDGIGTDARADRRDHALGCGDLDPWRDAEWIACRDGKHRPTQPGLRPLASGVPGRVGRLRAYGNAIVPQLAAQFIMAFMEARG